ncbi:hypothetical protein AGMMS49525_02800 [Bacteroidia bacterium]|nr:hypothetical protein AGMMS49525_02800 [Bacteroidia bacterium]
MGNADKFSSDKKSLHQRDRFSRQAGFVGRNGVQSQEINGVYNHKIHSKRDETRCCGVKLNCFVGFERFFAFLPTYFYRRNKKF